jgi:hypothetical protein
MPTVGWIPGDSRHGRPWGAGEKKEDDEGIRFHLLPMVERHRGGGNLTGKKVTVHCSSSVPGGGAGHQGTHRAVQEEAGRERGHDCRGKGAAVGGAAAGAGQGMEERCILAMGGGAGLDGGAAAIPSGA